MWFLLFLPSLWGVEIGIADISFVEPTRFTCTTCATDAVEQRGAIVTGLATWISGSGSLCRATSGSCALVAMLENGEGRAQALDRIDIQVLCCAAPKINILRALRGRSATL